MIGDLLGKKLKDLEGTKVLIVMDDGLAFLGKLVDHDSSTLILEEVCQAPSKDIKWKEIPEEKGKEAKVGYIDWTDINLDEVYVRIEHVLRIWRWETDVEDKTKEWKRREREPIYSKDKNLPDERLSSMGDIQDTFQ